MIKRDDLLAFEFYKKKPFKGSDKGLRYMITQEKEPALEAICEENGEEKTETVLAVYIWPEPFCFEATKEERKMKKTFSFDEEGLNLAMNWINEIHDKALKTL